MDDHRRDDIIKDPSGRCHDFFMCRRRARAFSDWVDPPGVITRLDPKSGLPDFGIKLSKSETSDFDAIQYPGSVVTGSPGQTGR
jgi:hypothetical protein